MTEAEKHYKTVIQRLVDAIYICDASGRIKLFNNAAVQLWGREPQIDNDLYCGSFKLLNSDGKKLPIEYHPMYITINEKKSLDNAEVIIQHPDGSLRKILNTTSPIYNVNGELTGAVNLLSDITNKHKKKHEKKAESTA
jgi:PAS domain S-box-containing protein